MTCLFFLFQRSSRPFEHEKCTKFSVFMMNYGRIAFPIQSQHKSIRCMWLHFKLHLRASESNPLAARPGARRHMLKKRTLTQTHTQSTASPWCDMHILWTTFHSNPSAEPEGAFWLKVTSALQTFLLSSANSSTGFVIASIRVLCCNLYLVLQSRWNAKLTHAGWNVSQNQWMYFTWPSGEKPLENTGRKKTFF